MSFKSIGCGLMLISCTVANNIAYAVNSIPEIDLKFTGKLVAEPCVIEPGHENIFLDFGNIIDKYLYMNTRTHSIAFEIHLAECDLNVGSTVSITLQGLENPELPGLLALDSSSKAKGIAIGLETHEAKHMAINTRSDKYTLHAGSNIITLKAYVQGEPSAIMNGSIIHGPLSAVATLSLNYE
ncbi:fimbrial protein [Enterobacter bugandensis]|uniref:fimbrial protein n=1 Tax=Enterobacter bugandensis TaxID=881260 RepID=UPI0013D322BF|nr:fimbrial protein [Enterobacter bugandensis]